MLFILIFVAGMAGIVRPFSIRAACGSVVWLALTLDMPTCPRLLQRFLASSLFLLITLFTGN